jgi:hypothetical protein
MLHMAVGSHHDEASEPSVTGHHHGVSLLVEAELQQFVDAHVEHHGSIFSADDGSNEAIRLASKSMKEHFQVFPSFACWILP